MNNVIEFKSRTSNMLEKKYARFDVLKGKEFSDILTPSEEKEYNELDKWFEIHIRSKRNSSIKIN